MRVARMIGKRHLVVAAAFVTIGIIAAFIPGPPWAPINPDKIAEIPSPLRTISIDSLTGLTTAINAAVPGDQILVKNGIYNTSAPVSIATKGTAEHPIVISAENAGGAEIVGDYGFLLDGAQHVIIRDFKFTHSQDNSASTDDMAIMCNDCYDVRFTSNTFALTTEYAGQGDNHSIDRYQSDWLGITGSGSNNRIDHNLFQNKSTKGTFLLVLGHRGSAVQNTIIDDNHFLGEYFPHGNGGECMRIGNSILGPSLANTVIEYNTFERCNGDREAVSIKSSNNTIRYNTFRDNDGSLTFRHGSSNIAVGNIFIDGYNGIRIYGSDHKIINNYFANNPVQVSSLLSPIVVGRGTVLIDKSILNAEYSQSRNIVIAHNTLVNNRAGIVVGEGDGKYLPEGILVANNIMTSSSGELVKVLAGAAVFKNNIVYPTGSATAGDIPTTGYANVNPQLVTSNGILRPAASSPAIDAISPSDAYGVTRDIDGQIRSGKFDIGADETRG